MYKNKLTGLLSTWSVAELKQFKLFLASPYFNRNQKLIDLFTIINKYAPHFSHSSCTNEKVYTKVFGKGPFNNVQLIKLTSKLFKLAEQFIAHQSLNEQQQQIYLLDFYTERNLDNYFLSTINKFRANYIDNVAQDNQWFFNKYQLELKQANYLSNHPEDYKADINLQAVSDALDNHYLITKLQHLCYLKNRERTVSVEYQYNFALEIEEYLQQRQDTPFIIHLWSKIFQLLHSPQDISKYQDLKQFLSKQEHLLSLSDKRDIYAYLENMAKFVFPTKKDYFKELFTLYKNQLAESKEYVKTFLCPNTFRNITKVGLYLQELDWVESFIDEHKDNISTAYLKEENIHGLCLTMLTFAQQKYSLALDYINETKVKNIYLKLETRSIRIKIYYELRYFDLFHDSINSFRKFLSENRKHIAPFYLDAYRLFINLINNIYNTLPKDHDRIENLEEKANSSLHLPEKKWILTKLNSLK